MAVDDLPRPANPTINLGGIPASQDTFRSTRRFFVVELPSMDERRRRAVLVEPASGPNQDGGKAKRGEF